MKKNMSLLIYPGSKRRYTKALFAHLPHNVKFVVSGFFGGGSFEFFLAAQGIRIIAVDTFRELCHFWNEVQCNPEKLAQLVWEIGIMTISKYKLMLLEMRKGSIQDPTRNAAVFFVLNRCAFSGRMQSTFRHQIVKYNHFRRKLCQKISRFAWPASLTLLHMDYKTLLRKFSSSFVFLDPPYWLAHPNANTMYGFHGEHHRNFNHQEFFAIVSQRKAQWLITYNSHPTVVEFFSKIASVNNLSTQSGFSSVRNKERNKIYHKHILIKNYGS